MIKLSGVDYVVAALAAAIHSPSRGRKSSKRESVVRE
jgi:hypothetical protein